MTQEYYNQLVEDFNWLRKKESFNSSDIDRLSNMGGLYTGNNLKCHSCGGGMHKFKWDLVGWMDGTIQNVNSGLIKIEDQILIKEIKKEEKTVVQVAIEKTEDYVSKTSKSCKKCGGKMKSDGEICKNCIELEKKLNKKNK